MELPVCNPHLKTVAADQKSVYVNLWKKKHANSRDNSKHGIYNMVSSVKLGLFK